MNVNTFVEHVGDALQEDFVHNVIWTKSQVLEYLRLTLREFSELTLMVDYSKILPVSSTTGESTMPDDFNAAYLVMFEQVQQDLVRLGELDFASGMWSYGTTGTPRAASVFGAGTNAVLRFAPVPSTATSDSVATYQEITDSTTNVWRLGLENGVAVATDTATTSETIPNTIKCKGAGGTYWNISVGTDGVLSTASTDSTGYAVSKTLLVDSVTGYTYQLYCATGGVLEPTNIDYGICIAVGVDGTDQDFDSEYGEVSDVWNSIPSTSSTDTITLADPTGFVTRAASTDSNAYVWYKGYIRDVRFLASELPVADGLVPVLLHGVLARAFAQVGNGQDTEKAGALEKIFEFECDWLKRTFQRRI